jgi:hypothetical protein
VTTVLSQIKAHVLALYEPPRAHSTLYLYSSFIEPPTCRNSRVFFICFSPDFLSLYSSYGLGATHQHKPYVLFKAD